MTNGVPPRPNRLLIFEIWQTDGDKKILETTMVFFLTTKNLDKIILRWLTTVVSGKKQAGVILKFMKGKKGGKYLLSPSRYLRWYQLR